MKALVLFTASFTGTGCEALLVMTVVESEFIQQNRQMHIAIWAQWPQHLVPGKRNKVVCKGKLTVSHKNCGTWARICLWWSLFLICYTGTIISPSIKLLCNSLQWVWYTEALSSNKSSSIHHEAARSCDPWSIYIHVLHTSAQAQ